MAFHSNESGSSIHVAHAFTFANTAAREGIATLVAADVGKIAKQTDEDSYWILIEDSPVEWAEITVQGGAGGGVIFYLPSSGGPLETFRGPVRMFDFDQAGGQVIYAKFPIPVSYKAGNQLKLTCGLYITTATTNNVLFRTSTALIQPGTTVLPTTFAAFTNKHTSSNVEKTVPGTPNTTDSIGDIDLTDAIGEINSVAVAPGDELLIELTRATSSESVTATAPARLDRDSFKPTLR